MQLVLTTMEGHEPLEMGLIGNEGMFGDTLAIDIESTGMQVMVQGSGESLRLSVSHMRHLLRKHPKLMIFLTRYLYVQMEQLVQSANCRYYHAIQPRLIRWLLMSHDRAHCDTLELTHKFMASMLGVRRSGVSVAAGDLQDKGLINYRRGQIVVLNRKGLEVLSCECYGNMLRTYNQYFRRQGTS
jgi:CRP-like cAMP-binding protein